jgi:hypothetical protein
MICFNDRFIMLFRETNKEKIYLTLQSISIIAYVFIKCDRYIFCYTNCIIISNNLNCFDRTLIYYNENRVYKDIFFLNNHIITFYYFNFATSQPQRF